MLLFLSLAPGLICGSIMEDPFWVASAVSYYYLIYCRAHPIWHLKLAIIQIRCRRWSTSTSTRSPPSALETSVLQASTARRPCTLASACSATLCLTGKSSPSPSAVSSSAPPSSWATTGRSRARLARLHEEACVCK